MRGVPHAGAAAHAPSGSHSASHPPLTRHKWRSSLAPAGPLAPFSPLILSAGSACRLVPVAPDPYAAKLSQTWDVISRLYPPQTSWQAGEGQLHFFWRPPAPPQLLWNPVPLDLVAQCVTHASLLHTSTSRRHIPLRVLCRPARPARSSPVGYALSAPSRIAVPLRSLPAPPRAPATRPSAPVTLPYTFAPYVLLSLTTGDYPSPHPAHCASLPCSLITGLSLRRPARSLLASPACSLHPTTYAASAPVVPTYALPARVRVIRACCTALRARCACRPAHCASLLRATPTLPLARGPARSAACRSPSRNAAPATPCAPFLLIIYTLFTFWPVFQFCSSSF
ncbi:hypothetical protein B0H11DRAFT_2276072 [Mycena galericulata]|nr:hypothetical protein B0H11DRAFT_2276072 [Mycena galericulata]